MAKKNELVKARVLCDGPFGKVDDVIQIDAGIAEQSSDLDPHPDAVAYAESLKPVPQAEGEQPAA